MQTLGIRGPKYLGSIIWKDRKLEKFVEIMKAGQINNKSAARYGVEWAFRKETKKNIHIS